MNCERCGALLDPRALECPYCQLTTPLGLQARAQEDQAAQARAGIAAAWAMQQRRAAQAEVNNLGWQALAWSLVGVVLCCLPLGVVGIVQGLRARSRAASYQVAVPGNAIAALVFGGLSLIFPVGIVTYVHVDTSRSEERANVRIAALEKQIGAKADAPTLDHDVACALAEQFALKHGLGGTPGYDLDKFDCAGKLTQSTDAATLEDFKVDRSGSNDDTFVCFKRGIKWYVDRLSTSGGCESSSATPSASVSGAPSASVSSAPSASASAAPSASSTAPTPKPKTDR